ncbi:MAG: hypothetical protein L0G69_17790, partial [Brevibacterium sp.]|nr:hypothetical protein [Brevibacterium sp.]
TPATTPTATAHQPDERSRLVASFPAGMTLADTFMVGGADHAPWAIILHAVSTLSILALAGFSIARAARTPRATRG